MAKVSKGTYIRTLVNDIANKLGTVAVAYELDRTRIGDISLNEAVSLFELKTVEDIEKCLIKE